MEGYDISKIISVIMENPGLVEQIRTLAAPKPETQETAILSKEPEVFHNLSYTNHLNFFQNKVLQVNHVSLYHYHLYQEL